jgi:hypothetical protein
VRPLLELTTAFVVDATAGLRLANAGLGPARIISSQLRFGDEELGAFNQPNVDEFRDRLVHERLLNYRPHAATLGGQPYLPKDYQEFLLSVDHYEPSEDGGFAQVIQGLRLEIQYESIYGERFTVFYPRREWASSPPAEDGS